MADRYWVGGSGNWSSTSSWSTSSGGSSGASVPTSSDSVIFDAGSNVGTGAFTVTVDGTSGSPSQCLDFSTGGAGGALDGAMTLFLGTNARLNVYGSWTNPATNFSFSASSSVSSEITFASTSSGKTITTNGVTFLCDTTFNGVGGVWTLGSAFNNGSSRIITLTNGTFDTSTSNYSVTTQQFVSNNSNVRTINLNGSTLTIAGSGVGWDLTTSTNATLNAGTSTINISSADGVFNGGGLTYYDVAFTSTGISTVSAQARVMTGANTFRNLTVTTVAANGAAALSLGANQTISGTLTLGAANTAVRRVQVYSNAAGTQRTITLNGTLATLSDVDFRDIVAAGTAGTWTGTRIGNGLNNSGITFTAAKTVYWNLAGTQNWSATGWATTNNGAPAVNNFPLPQDTATFTEAGSAGTVTIDALWWIGNLQMADGVSNRTTAFTLATGTTVPRIFGNVTLFSNLTLTGTGAINFWGYGNTQTITSAGITFSQAITVNASTATFKIADNFTQTDSGGFTLTVGTVDLNSKTMTCNRWTSTNSNTRSILFGTGNITVTGNSATIWNMATLTGFTCTGTPTVNCTYSGATGTRTISHGTTTGGTESNSVSFNITAGTDTIASGSGNIIKNFNFTGFSGTLSNNTRTIYGNLIISSGMTLTAGANATTFAATSGTQQITTNGKTLDFPVTFNGAGGTFQLQDAMTVGSTRTTTLTNGTLDLNNLTVTTGTFLTASGTKNITFNGGTFTIVVSGSNAWNNAQPTNFTTTAGTGTGTISLTSASAKTFVGGGSTYNCTLNQGGAGALTVTGSNTFTTIANSVQPTTITFTSGTTQTVTNWNVNGTAGNLVTVNTTASSQATLSKSSGTVTSNYLSLRYSAATGGAKWFALNSVDNGGNTGWNGLSSTNGGAFFLF